MAILRGYAAGINYYAAEHSKAVLHNSIYPITEFDIAAHFLFTVQDFVHLESLASMLLSGQPLPIPLSEFSEEPLSHRDYAKLVQSKLQEQMAPQEESKGSTAYAMAPSRADGSTFLAINPHQTWKGLNSLISYYLVTIHTSSGWNFTGLALPGIPVPLMGHNPFLGWAHTINHPDLIDIFSLRLNPQDNNEYWFDGKWIPFERRTVRIASWLWNTIPWTFEKEIISSRFGPAVRVVGEDTAIALSFSGFDSSTLYFVSQYVAMGKATSVEDWENGYHISAMPMMNALYADHNGTILHHYGATLPVRSPQ